MGHVRPKAGCYRPGIPAVKAKPSAYDISKSPEFIAACEQEGVQPTVRQARKYRMKIGRWAKRRKAESA